MSHPIDVGSVLGGRYKVTATVLSSHDQDLVLDGVDQVLNRPVSILVAGPHNADQVAQSAREVATGERPGNVQILDLGVSDSTTYLITNHTTAVDLLDLVVASNPPYVEPFFTDTLGSEIFGQARSLEPEIYDDEEEVDAGYISYADAHPRQADSYPASMQGRNSGEHGSRPSASQQPAGANSPGVPGRKAPIVPPLPPGRPGSVPPGAGAAAGAAAGGAAATRGRQQTEAPETTAPQPVQRENVEQALLQREGNRSANPSVGSQESAPAGAGVDDDQPRVSLWSEDDYDYPVADEYADDQNAQHENSGHSDRRAGNFPAVARTTSPAAAGDYHDEDHNPQSEPRSMRWLVGGLLAAVLIVGLIFAVTNLGSLFKTTPQAQSTPPASSAAPQTATPSPTQSTAPAVGPPAVESVTRQGTFDFASTYDNDLSKTFDGNAASYWSDMEFATDNWGGLAPDGVPLVVKLKGPSKVSSITLNQLGGSGGSISVFTNDRPSMDGAKQVGTNSFTSPDLTMPLAEPVTAQYVIVSIKNLPKLAAPKTRYGFGLRLAEIRIQ
ncbi:ABC transporter substrate-binding protein [Arthrobacter sp. ISL-28]|uniref:ABC transporter substrate-binding protein n=1 Tax=Arthrobacter sp. ISL-28 TaxID=2819108 RepID=UPI001BEA730E|nr:ABC transporter substrate-binding protein [Arthrobacter sp. ISL-28]MBT2522301.1 ABC transporter substrate-binding protein [Arthrobacter sp. ISL-28]